MNRSTKGAVAAAAAAVLLLGGAGSLAYWNATDTVDGGTLTAGTLTLSDVACGADWLEDAAAVTVLVPGDTVTKVCAGTITMTGDHNEATVAVDTTSVAPAIAAFNAAAPNLVAGDAVTITAGLTSGATATATGPVSITITVTWPYGTLADNESQGVSTSALDGLVVNAVQVEPHP